MGQQSYFIDREGFICGTC